MTEHAPPPPTPAPDPLPRDSRPPTRRTSSSSAPARPARRPPSTWRRPGLNVLLLEKSRFPREKVCGDGLTPRAVKALVGMGISVGEQDGWVRNKGLRVIGAGKRLELPWPELTSYPGYGLVRTRHDLDESLARRAQQAGAKLLEGVTVTGPVIDERTGQITGVTARAGEARGAHGSGSTAETTATTGPSGSTPPGPWWRRTATPPGSRWRWACASATTARSASRSGPTTGPPGTTTTTWSPGSTCGTATGCCPGTAGSSAWGTGRPTSAWAC